MDDAQRYQRDLDIVFQELEEKEQLRRQAASQPRAQFLLKLLSYKSVKELLAAVTEEERVTIVNECIRKWEENRERMA